MGYAELNSTDTENFFTLFRYINNVTTGLFFPVILGSIWMIFFILGLAGNRGASRSWLFSSFICSILSVLLALMGLLNINYMYFLVFLTAFGILWTRFDHAVD